jgi:hypothetical protein
VTVWELIDVRGRDGFTLELHFTPEDDAPEDHFATGDAAADAYLCASIRCGDLLWFVARVTASRLGVTLGTSYLSGCCYDSADQFIDNSYDDLADDAIAEAWAMLAKLASDYQSEQGA